jgi:perosamine synthetase
LLAGREREYVAESLAHGWLSSTSPFVPRFERAWADQCDRRHGIAVSSGTAALHIAIDALGLAPGDEVILPSFTIISCALAIVRAGAVPVPVDCDAETFCIDPALAAGAVTRRTRAIMPVHMYGHPADMDPLLDLADAHGIAVVEDAAQGHGAEYESRRADRPGWRPCGAMGTVSTFSFYANKLVTTGEGGMVLTDSDAIADRCRALRDLAHGDERFRHVALGHAARMSGVQAAIGLAQVDRVSATLERKRAIAQRYDAQFASVQGLQLPASRRWARPSRWMYAIVLGDDVPLTAADFADALAARGVETRPFFLGIHEQPVLLDRGLFAEARLPVTERLRRRGLYLPSGPALADADVDRVVETVRAVLAAT